MGFVISDGKRYLHKSVSGDFVPGQYSDACVWDQKVKAENVLMNCLNRNLRGRYHIEETNPEKEAKPTTIRECKIPIRTIVDIQNTSLEDVEMRRGELNKKLSNIDLEISDIHHYIELGTFNAFQGWEAFSMLKYRLENRRKIKDEILLLNHIIFELKSNQSRRYTPRKLFGLFK